MPEHAKTVQIHIDGHHYEVPAVTTGATLYSVGQVKPEYDLFREVKGPGDDQFVENSTKAIEVHSGDQFYSAKRTLNPGA
ncbi:MAG: hypothetical protein ACJ796_14185 [Gemmatimonadaceae bacterium]